MMQVYGKLMTLTGACSGGSTLCNLSTNLGCAKKVYGWGGNTWKNWSTCSICGCCNSA